MVTPRAMTEDRPGRRRGGKLVVVLAGLAALFVAGALLGTLLLDRRGDVPGYDPLGVPLSAEGTEAASTSTALEGGGTQRLPVAEDDSSAQVDAEGGTLDAVRSGRSDADAAAKPPAQPKDVETSQPDATELLERFDASLAPAALAGFARQGSASVSGDTITATYSGGGETDVDLLRLTIARRPGETEAAAWVSARAEEFGGPKLSFEWAGRSMRQTMTAEDRPEEYPPAVSLAWATGRFAVEVAVIPVAPDAVAAARQSGLAFVSGSPY